ncbi:alpha/beta hydrolase [Paraburkholderia sp.]|uniref:RBBP9/YdeN family alpha/beta hydrolase n=1 Tax=Paraburkholderia sp. TaxID=1926495 RepID=UPI002391F261|nr:alpha/beta hydrolase [Paraburkholderia sp.]MDE1179410.1 alpha/beta hydrolase [Paraburkholderia sp.]
MDFPVLVVPGIGNSGPAHWQTRWQSTHPTWQRLAVDDWDRVVCDDWVAAIDRQVRDSGPDTVIVAHSLGCLAVAHWGARHATPVRGAWLVAVPDPEGPAFPSAASGFAPLPRGRLPFPGVIVASTDDPYGSAAHARDCADAWGSELHDVGARGHLNAASGLGDWPDGLASFSTFAGARP